MTRIREEEEEEDDDSVRSASTVVH